MGRIRILPDAVANKIAAGEVVERPAAVVKELVENSLDAGARKVTIEVAGGGRRLIRVADDGCGMNEDDALLAFERHATSKLRDADDLLAVETLGFRGEALPSIASVSRLTLETATADDPVGVRVELAGGRLLGVHPEALAPGSTVAVRDLFYNTPVRRKFLRSEKTELAHIASLVTHYGLAHPDKSLRLTNETGALLDVSPVATLGERVYQVFGADVFEQLLELPRVAKRVEAERSFPPPARAVEAAAAPEEEPGPAEFGLRGFVSKPQIQKLNRNAIYVFVNNRLIRDRVVLKAITSAYHNILPPGQFPFALLFLEIPFDEVDVNVHPSKTEVRFRRQSLVYDLVRDSIRELLTAAKPAAPFRPGPWAGPPAASDVREGLARRAAFGAPAEVAAAPRGDFALRGQPPPAGRFAFDSAAALAFAAAPALAPAELDARPHSRAALVDGPVEPAVETLADVGALRPLGQIRDSFIVAAGPDGLWIIDQHVAHERILFEKNLGAHGRLESQRLLMPLILTLRPGQELVFERIDEEFRLNGFDLEPFGARTVAVKAAPAGLEPHDVEALIQEILDAPERELRELSLDDVGRRVAASVACHAAIKINTPLDGAKMRWLLDELARTEHPMACPHGRPIALKYDLKEILKAFHRI